MGLSKEKKAEIQKLESQGLKRFMVGEVQEQIVLRTIYAKNANDAVQAVIGGAGRPAGLEGPNTLMHLAREIGLATKYRQGDITKAYLAMRAQVAQLQQQKRVVTPGEGERKIVIPKIVPPTDIGGS